MVQITTAYQQGASVKNPANYLGHSEVFKGERISKGSEGCDIHASCEFMRIAIGECLNSMYEFSELPDFIIQNLEFLFSQAFNFATFAFSRGTYLKYAFGASLTDKLREEVAWMSKEFETTSFISFSHPTILSLDKARVSVRKLEQNFVSWLYSEHLVKELFRRKRNELIGQNKEDEVSSDEMFKAIYETADYLNTLSEWIFTVSRYVTYRYALDHTQWTRETTYGK